MFRLLSLLTPYIDGYPEEAIRCSENAGIFIVVTYNRDKIGGKKLFNPGELVIIMVQKCQRIICIYLEIMFLVMKGMESSHVLLSVK